jgi:hypothetical protein
MTTTEELIERDRIRKQKSVEAQRRCRKKLKEGTALYIYIYIYIYIVKVIGEGVNGILISLLIKGSVAVGKGFVDGGI